jgi:hypothetical protein
VCVIEIDPYPVVGLTVHVQALGILSGAIRLRARLELFELPLEIDFTDGRFLLLGECQFNGEGGGGPSEPALVVVVVVLRRLRWGARIRVSRFLPSSIVFSFLYGWMFETL